MAKLSYQAWEKAEGKSAHSQSRLAECCHYLKDSLRHKAHFEESLKLSPSKDDAQGRAAREIPQLKQSLLRSLYNDGFSVENAIAKANALLAKANAAGRARMESELNWVEDRLIEYTESPESALSGLRPKQLREKISKEIVALEYSTRREELRRALWMIDDHMMRGEMEEARRLCLEVMLQAEKILWPFAKHEAEGRLRQMELEGALNRGDLEGALEVLEKLALEYPEQPRPLPARISECIYNFAISLPPESRTAVADRCAQALPQLANPHNLKVVRAAIGELSADATSDMVAWHSRASFSSLLDAHADSLRTALVLSFFMGQEEHANAKAEIEAAFLSILDSPKNSHYKATQVEIKKRVRTFLPELFEQQA